MQIKKQIAQSLIDAIAPLEKLSRKKKRTEEETSALSAGMTKVLRSVLSTLKKLK